MPELPEVETIRIQLEKFLVGDVITKIEIRNPKYEIQNKFKILNQEITNIRRFAKVLSLDLSNNYSILIHVKMTGQLIYIGNRNVERELSKKVVGGVPGKHTHVIFYLNKGTLYFNDVRKFGWVRVINNSQLTIDNFIANLGPEPFGDALGKPGKLTMDYFSELLSKSKRNIKTLLMDQGKIGGLGNIYANDALWLAKIDPRRVAISLNQSEVGKLYKAIHKVLRAGLKYGGASEQSYVTPDGNEGKYQNHFLVYGKDGKPCNICKSKTEKFFISGRGTYWCPSCQK